MRRLAAALMLTALMLTSACGGSDGKDSSTPDKSLKNADDVKKTQDASSSGEVGQFVKLPGVGRFEVTKMQLGGDELGPWLETTVRIENTSSDEVDVPDLGIYCAGGADGGGTQADSKITSDPIPAGSFKEGEVNVLVSSDSRTGEAVPECKTPAYVKATPTVLLDGQKPALVRVPDNLIAQMNSKRVK